MTTKSMNLIRQKVDKLESLYGWKAESYGVNHNDKYFVEWATPAYTAEFDTIQGLHAYLNNKLGLHR